MSPSRPIPAARRFVPVLLAGSLLADAVLAGSGLAATVPATTVPATTVPAATVLATTVPATTVPAATLPASSPESAAANAARDMVRRTSDAVLAIIRDDTLTYSEKRARMDRLLADNVDLEYMSRLVMARNWSRFSSAQQADFIKEFQTHLVLTYFNNIANAKIDHIEIEEVREEEKYGHVIVNTKVVVPSGGLPVYIEYRVHTPEGGSTLKIIDLSVEEIKLVSNFRSQFKEVFSNGGADHLLSLLRDKNAALSAREAERDKTEAVKG